MSDKAVSLTIALGHPLAAFAFPGVVRRGRAWRRCWRPGRAARRASEPGSLLASFMLEANSAWAGPPGVQPARGLSTQNETSPGRSGSITSTSPKRASSLPEPESPLGNQRARLKTRTKLSHLASPVPFRHSKCLPFSLSLSAAIFFVSVFVPCSSHSPNTALLPAMPRSRRNELVLSL
jgi:hypothetical protein